LKSLPLPIVPPVLQQKHYSIASSADYRKIRSN
jgi:hypothetical protein